MNLQEENRNGFVVSAERKKLWDVQLKLLEKLLEVCDKHDIKIFAGGGTQLGAIREHGFIPWDDDIDMCMLRDQYDKLVNVAQQEFKSPYFFQNTDSEEDFPKGFAKLRMDGTTFIMGSDAFQSFHQGIFIDIFPLDAFPDKSHDYEMFKSKALKMKNHLYMYKYFKSTSKLSPTLWKRYLCGAVAVFLNGGYRRYHKKYIDLFRQNKISDNEYVGSLTLDFDKEHCCFHKRIFKEAVYVPFEDTKIPVPSGYDEFLTTQYGDYMTPVQCPSQHSHDSMWIDTERNYTDLLPSIRKDKKDWRKKEIIRIIKQILHIK